MYVVTALYKFVEIVPARLEVLRDEITQFCARNEIRGLFLISVEGCNGTMAGREDDIASFKSYLKNIPEFHNITFKDSHSDTQPFRRLKIDLREEIVTLRRPDIVPSGENHHLTPKEWHDVLQSDQDFLLLDTRNSYETELGMFKGAVDPGIENFSDFPHFIESQNIAKDKKILMYCTGGIRCEKALIYMQQEGFKNVFQLEGGILNYLEKYRGGHWEGECFVFDHRVSVDKNLEPSKQYVLCPHCGNPAKEKITCINCKETAIVCHHCLAKSRSLETCSKNCAYHAHNEARSTDL